MGMLCAVAFSPRGQLHYADPGELSVRVGDQVLVPTEQGPIAAQVIWAAEWVSEDTEGFPRLVGMADANDLERTERVRRTKARTLVAARRLVREHDLDMKVVAVDPRGEDAASDQRDTGGHSAASHSGRSRSRGEGATVIYYTAPDTVDFRSLLRDLSATLGSRVELRHLPARDAVRVTGAIGSCGRDTCCSTFLRDYEPITLSMARDQDLPTNPMRISGACGRLMCCLKYEHPLYQQFKREAPAIGEEVSTPAGDGVVTGHNVPGESLVVKLHVDGSSQVCPKASVCGARKAYETR